MAGTCRCCRTRRHRRRAGRGRVFILLALLALPWAGPPLRAAPGGDAPTLAVVATNKELAPLGDLLTAQLSEENVQLVERQRLDAVLQEQAISAAGLTDRATLIKVGGLVRADAFVLLSLEGGRKQDLLRVRVAETGRGVRLLDTLQPWEAKETEATARTLEGTLKGLVAKLALPPGQVTAVGIEDLRLDALNGPSTMALQGKYRRVPQVLKAILSARLAGDPHIIVLERQDLDLLMQEKELTAGPERGFKGSAVLLDGTLRSPLRKPVWQNGVLRPPSQKPDVEVSMALLLPPGNRYLALVNVPLSLDDPNSAAIAAAEQIIEKLANAPLRKGWDAQKEAAAFYRRGSNLWEVGGQPRALQFLQTAHALAPQNQEYAAKIHCVYFDQAFLRGDAKTAGRELATLKGYLVPLIKAGKADELASLSPALIVTLRQISPYRPLWELCDKDVDVAGRYYGLMKRMGGALGGAPALQINDDLKRMADTYRRRLQDLRRERDSLQKAERTGEAERVKSLIARYLKAFDVLREAPATTGLHMHMLLTARDWPMPWQWGRDELITEPHAHVRCRDGRIWIAFTDLRYDGRPHMLGMVGLDPTAPGPLACWQATLKQAANYLCSIQGFMPDARRSYVALGQIGIVVLPGTSEMGQGVVSMPRVLGENDGLPPGQITAIAGDPENMWVGYVDRRGGRSGLGIYNAETGLWKTVLAAPSGKRYEFSEIMPHDGGVLLYGSEGPGPGGIWDFDLSSGAQQQVMQESGGVLGRLSAGTEGGTWLGNAYVLLHVEPRQKDVELAVSRPLVSLFVYGYHPPWPVRGPTFAPPDRSGSLGRLSSGSIDLTTAAIHGDRLWARCGRSQIAIVKRGQDLEDARKIDNDILDGQPALRFFETPYGLLAVGEGTAGIVETGE